MKEYTKNLGKVVMTPKGAWSIEKEYEILDIVYDSITDHAYISKQEVPSGVDLSDSRYWMPLNVSGYSDSNVITLNGFNEGGEIQSYTLEEAIKTIKDVGRKSGAILIFYNDNVNRLDITTGCWEIWQFNSINVYDWENLDAWVNIYYNYNKFVGWYAAENVLNKEIPNPDVGCYVFVGNVYNEAFVYRCDIKNQWTKTNQKAQHYIKVVFGNNVTIGANGNWWQDGVDTNIPVSVKGDNGLTPYLRWSKNNQIEYSYDNINWYSLSERFSTNIKIKDYVNTVDNLPNNIELGTIYGVGPIYTEDDVEQTNPIYNVYVYTSNGWVNNGRFNSISAGVVQELGNSETEIISQAAITRELIELESEKNRNRIYLEDINAVIAELPMNTTTWQRTLYISLHAGDVIHITPILSGITSLDGVYLYFADGEREAIYSWENGRTKAVNINKKVTSIGFYYSAGSPTTDYMQFHLANRAVLETELKNIQADVKAVKSMSNVSYINKNIFLELGGLNAMGDVTPVNDRVRTIDYISAPITIHTKDNYKINCVCRYKVGISGNISFDSEIYVDNPIWKTIDTSYVYKIVFGKKSNTKFEQSELSEIILEYDSEYEQISKEMASGIGVISSYVDSYNISFAVDVAELSIINTKVYPFKAKAGDTLIINFLYSDILSDIAGFYLVNTDGTTDAIYSPRLTTEILLTKDIVGFKYYIDASNIVADGVITTNVRNKINLRHIASQESNLVKVNAKNKGFYSNGAFIEYSDGYSTNSENCGKWIIMTTPSYKKIHATLGFNALTDLAIGFYNDVVISKDAYIKDMSVPSKYGVQTYNIDIPAEAKMIVVLNRNNTLPAEETIIEVSMEIKDFVESELSASDYSANLVVPNWYKENGYLDNKIKRINDLVRDCAGHGDAFIFVTDEHIDYLAKNFRSPALIKYIMDKCPISKVFHGGDCCNGQDDLLRFFVDSIRAASKFGFYSVMGNHEYMNAQTDSSLYSYFSWFNKDQIGSENDRNYYYVDNLQQKIRYIVLNAFAQSERAKNEDVNGDGTLSEAASYGYENEQLEWLNNALDIDSTWTIIIVTHVLTNISMTDDSIYYDSNAANAYRILNEHNASDKAKIAFVIQGHTHRDRLILSDGKIPIIITTCDACVAYDNDINVDRTPYTINEQAFDVVVFDKKKKKATAVRIGAPALDGVNGVAGSAVEERVITW